MCKIISKMENEKKPLRISVSYIFKDYIDRVFECFKRCEIINDIYKCDSLSIKGGDWATKGAEIESTWRGLVQKFRVEEVKDTQYYKCIVYDIYKIIPVDITYKTYYHFYWNTIEKTTLYVVETVFQNPDHLEFVDKTYNQVEKIGICKMVEKYLQTSIMHLNQMESAIINLSIDKVWDVVTDWRVFKKFCPMICDNVVYDSSPMEINSQMHIFSEQSTSEFHLRVKEISICDEERNYILDYVDGKPKSPDQELHFKFISINKTSTFLSFKHIFKQPIKYELLYIIQKDKKQILSLLMKNMEKEFASVK
jgi:ribosome-associated toxin RatA of RatAB toxin-antitoxin module